MKNRENRTAAGERLWQWLRDQETSLNQLAHYAGVSDSTVSRWVRGELKPTGTRLGLAALALCGQVIRAASGSSIEPVASTRELVDWAGLYGYTAVNLRQAVNDAIQVYRSLAACPLLEELQDWPPMPLATLEKQTSGLPEVFVQRAADLEQVRGMLLAMRGFRRPTHRRVALWGMGGIGKTVLTKATIQDQAVQEHFRDGVLWSELGPEKGQTERKAAYWLRSWGHLLGLGLPAEATVWEWQAAIRRHLSDPGLRLLIVLDDVWWIEDVEPLLVGGIQAQVLLTTRNQAVAAGLPDCTLLEVGAMSSAEAHGLLTAWSGPKRQEQDPGGVMADELTKLVEANPLALALLGSLVLHRGWDYVLPRVRSQHLRLETISTGASATRYASVQVAIQVSYDALSPELRVCFRRLGVFPHGANIAAVPLVGLWELGAPELTSHECLAKSVDRLSQLYDRALLLLAYQEGPHRSFRLHTLIHDYARGALHKEQEWERVRHRYVDVYAHLARLMRDQYGIYPQAMDGEWHGIVGAFDYALELELYDHAAFYLASATSYLLGVGRLEEFDRLYALLQSYLDRLSAESRWLLDQSRVQRHLTMQEFDIASQTNESLLSNPDLPLDMQIYARLNQADICEATGNVESARRLRADAHRLGSDLASDAVQLQLARARTKAIKTEDDLEIALEKWNELAMESFGRGNIPHTIIALSEEANLLTQARQFARAEQAWEQALVLALQYGVPLFEYNVLIELGQLYLILARPQATEVVARRMLDLLDAMSLGERPTGLHRAFTKRLLGDALLAQGELDEALQEAREAVELSRLCAADPDTLGLAWQLLSAVHQARGELEDAHRAHLESARYLRAAGMEA